MIVEKCIYCAATFDSSAGEGDHVLPAALGEFKDDVRFRRICPLCNSRVGAFEQQVMQSGPEGFFRTIVKPASKRLRRRGGGRQRGAMGASAPKSQFQWDGWSISGGPSSDDPLGVSPFDQVVVRDGQGRDHSIRLFPRMRKKQLQQQVEQLAISSVREIRCFCSNESDLKDYSNLLEAVWPHLRMEGPDKSRIEPGVYEVAIHREFRVKDPYFQALAKIAFHYYLAHSQRGSRGDEPAFADIRDFIMNGGNRDRLFRDSGRFFADPFPPVSKGIGAVVPANWCHVLAANETTDVAVVYLRLFIGPNHLPKPVHVTLGQINSRVHVLRPVWAHAYVYEPVADSSRFCGHVYRGTIMPIPVCQS